MVFPTLFHLSLSFALRSSWSEPQSALGLAFAACIELLHLWLHRLQSIWFQYWPSVMSMCRVFSCVVGRGCLLWPVHSLGKTLLAFALLHFVLQSQTCPLLQVSFDCLLLHSSPLWWKGHVFFVLVLESHIGLSLQLPLTRCFVVWVQIPSYRVCQAVFSSTQDVIVDWGGSIAASYKIVD